MKKSRSHVHSEMTVTYRQIYEELANEMEGEHKMKIIEVKNFSFRYCKWGTGILWKM